MKDDCRFLVLSKRYPHKGNLGIDFCFILQRIVICKGKMPKCEKKVVWGVTVDIAEPRFMDDEQSRLNSGGLTCF